MSNIIEFKGVHFKYSDDDLVILNHLDLEIERGSFVSILGHNGSGKSTVARLMNGLLTPTNGDVTVNGINTKDEKHEYDIRSTVGLVFQNPDNQIIATVVEDDVAFGPENLGVEPKEIRARVDEALKTVDMYQERKKAPHLLSGGQKQRVAIAGILAMNPDVIVLDEPTAMLDPQGRKEVLSTLKKLNKEKNITVVLITHFMEEAAKAERVIVMDDGEIVLDAKPQEVFSEVEILKKAGLGVPQGIEFAHRLKEIGIDLGEGLLTESEIAEALTEKLGGK